MQQTRVIFNLALRSFPADRENPQCWSAFGGRLRPAPLGVPESEKSSRRRIVSVRKVSVHSDRKFSLSFSCTINLIAQWVRPSDTTAHTHSSDTLLLLHRKRNPAGLHKQSTSWSLHCKNAPLRRSKNIFWYELSLHWQETGLSVQWVIFQMSSYQMSITTTT